MQIPPPESPEARRLLAAFETWHSQNMAGGARLRWRRRTVIVAQILQRIGVHRPVWAPLFFGEKMRVITGEQVSSSLIAFGYSEVALTVLLLHVLRAGDTYIDIGTHFGYEAMLAAKIVGPEGRVVCFEPHPATHATASGNLSPFSQCTVRAEALGGTPGTMRLRDNSVDLSAFNHVMSEDETGDSILVPINTLDAALSDRRRPVTFIKCDAEGFELPIIDGGVATISADTPTIVLESDMPDALGQSAARTSALAARLLLVGYDAFNFDYQGSLRLAPLGEMRVHHANVLFIHRGASETRARLGIRLGE